jgi:hypothetical protein
MTNGEDRISIWDIVISPWDDNRGRDAAAEWRCDGGGREGAGRQYVWVRRQHEVAGRLERGLGEKEKGNQGAVEWGEGDCAGQG